MKLLLSLLVSAAVALPYPGQLAAQDAPEVGKQLKELVDQVRAKLQQGERTEEALADELRQFDALLKQHADTKTDEVAQVLLMKAMLYQEVIGNTDRAKEELARLQKDFAETTVAARAKQMIAVIDKQGMLAIGKAFPDFSEKDLEGNPLSVGAFKGKVVLVDFWATWCGPCVGELPNVLAAYDSYHDKGFEIIGISLDKDREKLTSFLKQRKMTWPQYFDGLGWKTKLAQDYGINSIPATYLVDRKGIIIAKNLRGSALEEAVGKALKE